MNIAVLSCANTGNFGDDIILEGIRIKMYKEYPDIGGTIKQILRINKVSLEFINSNDFLVVGGGEILSHSDILYQLTRHKIKVPYMFLSVGVGSEKDILPYVSKINPTMWYVRTKDDLDILTRCGIKEVMVCIDPIFDCPLPKRISNGRIGLNIKNQKKREAFVDKMAEGLDELIKEGALIDLLAFNVQPQQQIDYCGERITISDCSDLDLMQKIKRRMARNIDIVSYQGKNPSEFLRILSNYEGIVGERLHSAMAAHHANIDFRIVPYHEKINKFLRMNNLESKIIGADSTSILKAIRNLHESITTRGPRGLKGEK